MHRKTLLITGASGFIGTHLINGLDRIAKYDIVALSSSSIPGFKWICHNGYNFTKEIFIDKSITTIDYVIHAGSFTPKSKDQANDIDRSLSNILSTKKLISELPCIPKKFIFLSTLDVYGDNSEVIDEQSNVRPNNQYAWSKVYCEQLILEWARQNDVIVQILRVGHIYGPGEEVYKKFIPEIIKNIINNSEIQLFTNGLEKRSYLNIEDCVLFIIESLQLNSYSGPINLVSNKSSSILEILETLIDISGKPNQINYDELPEERGIDSMFNPSRRIELLGKEKISLFEGLRSEYQYMLKSKIENSNEI